MSSPPSTSALEASAVQARDDERAVIVAAARTLAVRYAVLMPKFKAVAFLQPEDHVKPSRISHGLHRSSLSGQLFVSATHNGSIFAAGCVLFLGQEFALRRLEPKSRGEFSLASPLNTAISGGFGGTLYSLIATATAAWVGTKGKSLLLSPEKRVRSWAFLRAALPYTLLRDCGGFALYFGSYAAVQSYARRLGVVTGRDERSDTGLGSGGGLGSGDGSGGGGGSGGDAISSRGFNAAATSNAAAASAPVETTNKLHLLTASPAELARGVGVAAASGGMVYVPLLTAANLAATQSPIRLRASRRPAGGALATWVPKRGSMAAFCWPLPSHCLRPSRSGGVAGLLSYLWRSPLDTLYKRAVGWRDANEPLWSIRRFLSSPRGGKAVAIGAVTWSIYEVADAGIRALAGPPNRVGV